MEKAYWIGRKRAAMTMAHNAECSQARLIHYELAGRYSLKAAYAPFMLSRKGAATESERLAILKRQPSLAGGHLPGAGR